MHHWRVAKCWPTWPISIYLNPFRSNCRICCHVRENVSESLCSWSATRLPHAERKASYTVQEVTCACRTLKCMRVIGCKKWHESAARWNVSHWVQEVTRACRTLKCMRVTGCKKWHASAARWNVRHWVQEVTRVCRTLICKRVTRRTKWHTFAAHWNVHKRTLHSRLSTLSSVLVGGRSILHICKSVTKSWSERGERWGGTQRLAFY